MVDRCGQAHKIPSMGQSPTSISRPANRTLTLPTLLDAFESERSSLEAKLSEDLSSAQTVAALRAALDRAGARYARSLDDPALQKSGLWLIEVIKSGVGILDRATQAEITYVETATPKSNLANIFGQLSLFYGAAGLLGLVGFVQASSLTILSAVILAALHTLEPSRFKKLRRLLPRTKPPSALEDQSGRQFKAEAKLRTDGPGLIGQIMDALKTSDAILKRLSEPKAEAHWADTPRLAALFQNLLEAGGANDPDFAMELIKKELPSLIASGGMSIVEYSKTAKDLFDELPGLGDGPKIEMAAPALIRADGTVLRRGTIWVRK